MSAFIRVEREVRPGGGVGRVTIDHDRKLNTLNSALMEEFVAAFGELAAVADLRAVVLTGAGERAFIGGADIGEMAGLEPGSARAFIGRIQACAQAIRDLPVPVIARIQGFAFGGGLEIAAACDLRIAGAGAAFGMPEVRLGIPSVIEAALLPMLIGWGRTRRLLLLGETLDAAEAERWGLVERVVPQAELDAAVEAWLEALLAAGPEAIRLQKGLIRAWEDLPVADAVAAGIEAFVAAWRTDEPRSAMQAFLAAQAARKGARKVGR